MSDAITALLFISLVILVGCLTRPVKKEMHDIQYYLHEQHKAEFKKYREDGRLPHE